jgi:hypothetical protein
VTHEALPVQVSISPQLGTPAVQIDLSLTPRLFGERRLKFAKLPQPCLGLQHRHVGLHRGRPSLRSFQLDEHFAGLDDLTFDHWNSLDRPDDPCADAHAAGCPDRPACHDRLNVVASCDRADRHLPSSKPSPSHGHGPSHSLRAMAAKEASAKPLYSLVAVNKSWGRIAFPKGRPDQQHRYRRRAHDLLRIATHEQTINATSVVGADHDEVRIPILDLLDNDFRPRVLGPVRESSRPPLSSSE